MQIVRGAWGVPIRTAPHYGSTSSQDKARSPHYSLHLTNTHIFRALRWHYGAATEDKGINEARANAAEIVACE